MHEKINENGNILTIDHLLIKDMETGEILVNKRGIPPIKMNTKNSEDTENDANAE